jgi:hypothetical protein
MSVVLEFLHRVPDVIWAALIAAGISYFATRQTNKNSLRVVTLQLQHDSEERDRERAMALRRDVYLPAAEGIVRAQQLLGQLVNPALELQDIQKEITNALVAISKIHLVGDQATVEAVMAYNRQLLLAYFELLKLRMPITYKDFEAKGYQGMGDRTALETTRTNELMKQFNISGQTDKAAWDRLVQMSEAEQRLMRQQYARAAELRAANLLAQQSMALRASELSAECAALNPDAVLAARRELGLPIDEAVYRQRFAEQAAEARAAAAEFIGGLQTKTPPEGGAPAEIAGRLPTEGRGDSPGR